jgi:hypothetical protein
MFLFRSGPRLSLSRVHSHPPASALANLSGLGLGLYRARRQLSLESRCMPAARVPNGHGMLRVPRARHCRARPTVRPTGERGGGHPGLPVQHPAEAHGHGMPACQGGGGGVLTRGCRLPVFFAQASNGHCMPWQATIACHLPPSPPPLPPTPHIAVG